MSLPDAIIAYLSEIQSEALDRIYDNAPSLRPAPNYPDWDGWRKILIRTSNVIGAFTTLENWDDQELQRDLGSLVVTQDIEKATLLWMDAEIIALAEYVKGATTVNDMYSFSDSLARRLQLLEYIDIEAVRSDLMQEYLSSRGKKGAEVRFHNSNQIKDIAWSIFYESYLRTQSFLSAKELFGFTEDYCLRTGINNSIGLKTFSNWLPNFKRRAKSGK